MRLRSCCAVRELTSGSQSRWPRSCAELNLVSRIRDPKYEGEGHSRSEKQGVLTENLWPKLFSEAPRCAPLRLLIYTARTRPFSKPLKRQTHAIEHGGRNCLGRETFTSRL